MNEVCTIVHSIIYLTVFHEPTSTSQLPFLSTAHSSWRYTATAWAHPHILQNGGEQSTCDYIWGMPILWPQYISGRWPQAGWHNGPGVWWAVHTPSVQYIGLCVNSLTIKQLLLIDMHLSPIDCLIVCPASRLLVCVAQLLTCNLHCYNVYWLCVRGWLIQLLHHFISLIPRPLSCPALIACGVTDWMAWKN